MTRSNDYSNLEYGIFALIYRKYVENSLCLPPLNLVQVGLRLKISPWADVYPKSSRKLDLPQKTPLKGKFGGLGRFV